MTSNHWTHQRTISKLLHSSPNQTLLLLAPVEALVLQATSALCLIYVGCILTIPAWFKSHSPVFYFSACSVCCSSSMTHQNTSHHPISDLNSQLAVQSDACNGLCNLLSEVKAHVQRQGSQHWNEIYIITKSLTSGVMKSTGGGFVKEKRNIPQRNTLNRCVQTVKHERKQK